MRSAPHTLLAAVALCLALSLAMASTALAHGGVPDGHEAPGGAPGALLIPPEFVLGGVAVVGLVYVLKRRRS